jgi:hypothetical protein
VILRNNRSLDAHILLAAVSTELLDLTLCDQMADIVATALAVTPIIPKSSHRQGVATP